MEQNGEPRNKPMQLIYNKGTKNIQWGKNKCVEKTGQPHAKV